MAEFVHEVLGHCLFVYLFGGRVTEIFISPLAPYIPSRLVWEVAGTPLLEKALIASAGIAASLAVSFIIQIVQSRRALRPELMVALFWVSFWTFVNTVAYMIIGLVLPFGDIEILMQLGVVSNLQLGVSGLIVAIPGLYLISKRLTEILSRIFLPGNVELFVTLFWILLPTPMILTETLRSTGPPTPMIGGSILLLLLPSTYLVTSYVVYLISGLDLREKYVRLRAADQGA
ncbi:MAG: hypothetical protein ACE5OO_03845 [Candidatus Bathyarchaeia archaeon]